MVSGEKSVPQSDEQRQALYELLRQKHFMRLCIGQFFSQIGDQCLLITAITLVTNFSASPLALLIPAIAVALPQMLFGLLGGVVADRLNRKYVMIISDIFRALLVLAVLLVKKPGDLWILYLSASGLAMAGMFFYPARNAVIPNMVHPRLLLTANGLIQGSYLVSIILGPMVAGTIIALWSLPAAILFDSISFVISAAITLTLRIPPNQNGSWRQMNHKSMWRDMQAGLRWVYRNPHLRRMLYVTAIATLGIGAVVILAFPHLKQQLEAGGLEYGGALSMLGVGALLGGSIASHLSQHISLNTIIGSMLIAAGIAVIAFAWAPNYLVILLAVIVLGLSVVATRAMLDTIAQTLSTDEMRGRVQAAINLVVAAGTALAEGVSALMGHFWGTRDIFLTAGSLTIVAGLISIWMLRVTAQLVHQRIAQKNSE